MPPKTKGTTTKKFTTKPISDPFLSDLSVNKPSSTLDSRQIHRTANPSPKKNRATRGVLNDSNGSLAAMEVEEIRIILEDFDVDANHKLRVLREDITQRLEATKRHWDSCLAGLDKRIGAMLYQEFMDVYKGEADAALRALSISEVHRAPIGVGEQSALKRKRVLESPLRLKKPSAVEADLNDDVFGSSTNASKKARAGPSSKKIPTSANRGASSRSGRGATPSKGRELTRLSIDINSNFTYRLEGALNPKLPPTPLLKGSAIKRHPRRGESIMMVSANDSPLGYLMADEVEGGQANEEEEEEADDWDLMDKHEASRTEDQSASKSRTRAKGKGKAKPIVTSSVPSSGIRRSSRALSASVLSPSRSNPPAQDHFTFTAPKVSRANPEDDFMRQMELYLVETKMSEEDREKLRKKLDFMKGTSRL